MTSVQTWEVVLQSSVAKLEQLHPSWFAMTVWRPQFEGEPVKSQAKAQEVKFGTIEQEEIPTHPIVDITYKSWSNSIS